MVLIRPNLSLIQPPNKAPKRHSKMIRGDNTALRRGVGNDWDVLVFAFLFRVTKPRKIDVVFGGIDSTHQPLIMSKEEDG